MRDQRLLRRLTALATAATQGPEHRQASQGTSAPPPPAVVDDDGNTFIPYHETRGTLINPTWHL